MSRISTALAATAMAVAAAGGGLLITAASAVRASASASGIPAHRGRRRFLPLTAGMAVIRAPRRLAAGQAPGLPFQRRFSGPA